MNNTNHITEKSAMKILYEHYMENDTSDAGEIQYACVKLDQLLHELILKDYDRIWDVAMKLCGLHEERGFDAGFRMGMKLRLELQEQGQERDS